MVLTVISLLEKGGAEILQAEKNEGRTLTPTIGFSFGLTVV
jgi:hypothetical protein